MRQPCLSKLTLGVRTFGELGRWLAGQTRGHSLKAFFARQVLDYLDSLGLLDDFHGFSRDDFEAEDGRFLRTGVIRRRVSAALGELRRRLGSQTVGEASVGNFENEGEALYMGMNPAARSRLIGSFTFSLYAQGDGSEGVEFTPYVSLSGIPSSARVKYPGRRGYDQLVDLSEAANRQGKGLPLERGLAMLPRDSYAFSRVRAYRIVPGGREFPKVDRDGPAIRSLGRGCFRMEGKRRELTAEEAADSILEHGRRWHGKKGPPSLGKRTGWRSGVWMALPWWGLDKLTLPKERFLKELEKETRLMLRVLRVCSGSPP